MSRILIVEDEIDLARLLEDYLKHNQFDTLAINDGAEVIAGFTQFKPDLILLDLMLPHKDGLSLCREIRSQSNVPIIMVTAKIEEIDRLLGLELGADDYICKPYSPREVVARVKAVLRRSHAQPANGEQTEHTRALSMDENTLTATLFGEALALTAVEFRLLQTLSENPRHIFSRDQLMDRMYKDHRVVNDRTIDSHIKNLRKKMEAVLPGQEIIKTVYGIGYKLNEIG